MNEWVLCITLGLLSGLLGLIAYRFPILSWLALSPLAAATYLASPYPAGVAGASAGVLFCAPTLYGRYRGILIGYRTFVSMLTITHALLWGIGFGITAWIWSDGIAGLGVLLFPIAIVAVLLPLRFKGAPRWIANPLVLTQENWLEVVHISRIGHDLVVSATLALSGSTFAILIVDWPLKISTSLSIAVAIILVCAAWVYGIVSYRRAVGRVFESTKLKVAAIVADTDPTHKHEQLVESGSDVNAAIARYHPLFQQAISKGVRVIVLPEVTVFLDRATRQLWFDTVCNWAKDGQVAVVVGVFDLDRISNELCIIDSDGEIKSTYTKQHPVPTEPRPQTRMPPAFCMVQVPDPLPLSAVICVDAGYTDLIRPVAKRKGLLAVPANDWLEMQQLHHKTTVWAAVQTGVPIVRATGHGISAIFDGAGHVISKQSSFDGMVVLIADVPIAGNYGDGSS